MTNVNVTDVCWATMPHPPRGLVWQVSLDPIRDEATVWLYKMNRLTGRSNGWSVICRGVAAPGHPRYDVLTLSTATVDELVEAIIATASQLVDEMSPEPDRREKAEHLARVLADRLGIKVRVKS